MTLTPRRFWTPAEDARLRELYPTHTADGCAAALGRPVRAVYHRARKIGLDKHPHWPAGVVERARQLNAEGHPDRVIAERMADVFGAGQKAVYAVKNLRQTHGWPHHYDLEGKRRAVARQRKTLGVRNGGELRALAYRRYAARCGWPDDLPPRAVQILNVLATKGPKTGAQLAAALGVRTKRNSVHGGPVHLPCSANSALCRGHGTYTGLLIARGLIVGLRRSGGLGSGKGGARRPNLYTLTPHAVRVRQEILDATGTAAAGTEERVDQAGRRGPADAAAGRDRRVR